MTSAVSLVGASFGYAGRTVLSEVDLDFEQGSSYAITGASGAGKSTLLFGIAGLIAIRTGQLHVFGQDVTQFSDADRARLRAETIGLVFQDSLLDPGRTVIDIVTEPRLYRAGRVDLKPQAQELLVALGVGQLLGRRPGQMSGGQAQRISVARALVTRPKLILADEPTGNLDDDSTRAVMTALLGEVRMRDATLLIATHDARITDLCAHRVALT